jgi:hypothetical protein
MTKHNEDTPIEQVIEKIESKDVSKVLNSLAGNFRILTFALAICIILTAFIVAGWVIGKLKPEFEKNETIRIINSGN